MSPRRSDRLPRPPQWVKPGPRQAMAVRVRREYKYGLSDFVERKQMEGWTGLTVAHVMEELMADLITEEGWAALEQRLRQKQEGFRPPVRDAPLPGEEEEDE